MEKDNRTEIAVLKEKVKFLDRQFNDFEETRKELRSIAISMKELSLTTKSLVEITKNMNKRITDMEMKPAIEFNEFKKKIIKMIIIALFIAFAFSILSGIGMHSLGV